MMSVIDRPNAIHRERYYCISHAYNKRLNRWRRDIFVMGSTLSLMRQSGDWKIDGYNVREISRDEYEYRQEIMKI